MGRCEIKAIIHILIWTIFQILSVKMEENYLSKVYNSIRWISYDSKIRPVGHDGTYETPTLVNIYMAIRSIENIDEVKMEFKTQITLQMSWKDERLNYTDPTNKVKYLLLPKATAVWLPDTFFGNEKLSYLHHTIQPNVYCKLFPGGNVRYSTRLSFTFSCPMNLKMYPLDTQVCSIQLSSYGHTANELVYLWKNEDPVSFVKDLSLLKFTLEEFHVRYCYSKIDDGEHTCIKLDLFFRRELAYYLKYYYLPYLLIVSTTWISFWLGQMVFIRLYVNASLLFIIIIDLLFRPSQIVLSYTTALDVWINVCLLFTVLAVVETAFVACSAKKHFNRYTKSINFYAGAPLAQQEESNAYFPVSAANKQASSGRINWLFKKLNTESMDAICRVLFPLTFTLFFLGYWIKYYFIYRV